MADPNHLLWEQAVNDQDYAVSSHFEARKYFQDFGLDGYRVGQVAANLGGTILAREVDYFSNVPEPVQVELPRALFGATAELAVGTRYAISHFVENLTRADGGVYARNNVTRIMVYEGDTKESDSLHATIMPIPQTCRNQSSGE